MKLYYCKIKLNSDEYVRDFVPCINSNRVADLYDKVNGRFYPSAGEKQFVYGYE